MTPEMLYEEIRLLEAEQAAAQGRQTKQEIQEEINHCKKQLQMIRCPNCQS